MSDHLALLLNPGVPFNVTPDTGETVICPVPACNIDRLEPIGKFATASVGIETVIALEDVNSNRSLLSARLRVYVEDADVVICVTCVAYVELADDKVR